MSQDNKPSHWLQDFARDFTSQCGEDGILEKILEVMPETDGWCVEFGAWDGKHLSNTYNLIVNHGYSAIMVEGDAVRFQDLRRTHENNPKVVTLNAFVGFEAANNLDTLLKNTPIPRNFDLLSIDVDGNDYHIWAAMKVYRPKILIIEYNPTIPNEVDFVQPRDMRITQGSSLRALDRLAREKKYALVATTPLNALFVDAVYFDLFGIRDNGLDALRRDRSKITYLFYGYDGTLFLGGAQQLAWHGMPFNTAKMQQLPRWLRKYPGNYSRLQRRLWKWFQALRQRNWV